MLHQKNRCQTPISDWRDRCADSVCWNNDCRGVSYALSKAGPLASRELPMSQLTLSRDVLMRQELEFAESLPTEGEVITRGIRLYDLGVKLGLFGRSAALYRHAAEAVLPLDGRRVLDIGCGTGLLTKEIARRMRSGTVIGIDASAPMIDYARRKHASAAAAYRLALAEQLPFPDASFDAVVSALFFHHVNLDLKARVAREIARVLKPGGKVAIADFVIPWTSFGRLYARFGWHFDCEDVKENVYGAVAAALTDAGLVDVHETYRTLGTMAVIAGRKQ